MYNRGVNGMPIFLDRHDYSVFLSLLKRHLGEKPEKDLFGRELTWLGNVLELEAYCLMPNHFHMLVYQTEDLAMPELMKALTGSYTRYFNKKHKRFGPLFQGTYKASPIKNDGYLTHISRYIHMNPSNYINYQYSSLACYLGKKQQAWLKPSRIIREFPNAKSYEDFLKDYVEEKAFQDELKAQLANK